MIAKRTDRWEGVDDEMHRQLIGLSQLPLTQSASSFYDRLHKRIMGYGDIRTRLILETELDQAMCARDLKDPEAYLLGRSFAETKQSSNQP